MENLSIKLRLIGLVCFLILMIVGVGLFGMVSTHNIIAHLEADAHKEQQLAHTLELAEKTEIQFKNQVLEWQKLLIRGNNPAQFEKHKTAFDKQYHIVQKGLSKLESDYRDLGLDTAEVIKVVELHKELKNKYETSLKKFNSNDLETGKKIDRRLDGIEQPINIAFDEMVHHLLSEIDNTVKASEAYAVEIETSTRNTDIAIILAGSVIGLLLGNLLIRSIVKPLNQVIQITQRLAEGDMTSKVNVVGKNEISRLQHALSAMRDKLHSIVSEVRNSATNVSTSSDEIAQGNLDLSSRTEEQAASIEETSASMEHITETVQQNSNSAIQAVELATKATEKAKHGLDVAQTAVTAINEIKTSSEKVADIIGVIDEIAFQTNLLALNASIEAERAGEQGRGFSVVANEVQKLAQRSADAANEIKELIKNSSKKVLEGTELVTSSSQSLEEIVQTSNETSELMQRISAASQEQATSLSQVNTAVAQLEETTQQNAALVEETSAASTSMSEQARMLAKLVSFFKIEHNEISTSLGENKHVATQAANSQTNSNKNRLESKKPIGKLALQSDSGSINEWEEF